MPIILKLKNASETSIQVPYAEYQVLSVLASLNKEAHGPAISRASQGAISVAAIYKLLTRLENRGLVHRREEQVQVGDITAKRVLYKVCETVTWPSEEVAHEAKAMSARRTNNSPIQEVENSEAGTRAFSP